MTCCQHEVFSAYPTIDDTVVHCQCLRCRHTWKEVYVTNAAERFFREHGMRIKTLKEIR